MRTGAYQAPNRSLSLGTQTWPDSPDTPITTFRSTPIQEQRHTHRLPQRTTIKQIRGIFRQAKIIFPRATLYFPSINFSQDLQPQQKENLDLINNATFPDARLPLNNWQQTPTSLSNRQTKKPPAPDKTSTERHIQSLYQLKFINAKQKDFLFGPNDPRHLYLLPKIHKDPSTWTIPYEVPPGRPIVSDCNSTSNNISQYIEHHLGPLSNKHPSYVTDTYHFLKIIRPMTVPTQSYLFTNDSLYTNIDTKLGLRAVSSIFTAHPDPTRPDAQLPPDPWNSHGPTICTILGQRFAHLTPTST
ncbi:hypothetical protein F7725_009365 [Dissostichus mawsoni]|uniref:Uncharacterized protein n=1 Tax=Dissostichus mawsoni TaxID=36200 RepID=A0A7J5Z774_DISMA|nr:hypothetical protein F7725_009365 [Dissostichus mawsoni]